MPRPSLLTERKDIIKKYIIMANRVSINNLREYAERMAKPTEVRYQVTMTPEVRDWFLNDLEQRAAKVAAALACDTIKDRKRQLREAEARDIIAVYEAMENAVAIHIEKSDEE